MVHDALERFTGHFATMEPKILRRKIHLETRLYEEMATIGFYLARRDKLQTVVGLLARSGELDVLYDIRHEPPCTWHQACLFSKPSVPYMYRVDCMSYHGDACDRVLITVYDSRDVMGMDLLRELRDKAGLGGIRYMERPGRIITGLLV